MAKLTGSLLAYLAIIFAAIYCVGIAAKIIGIKRAIFPLFLTDIMEYKARVGGFNLVDFAKIGAFACCVYFPLVIAGNMLSMSKIFFPPSAIAIRADIAITTLARKTIPAIQESDVVCFQDTPNSLIIKHSARCAFPWTWYKDNELAIENAVSVDFIEFKLKRCGTVIARFDYGLPTKYADILIEQPDNPGNFFKIRGNGGSYVYVYGNHQNYLDCTKFKIGWAERFENISQRGDEGERWETPYVHLLTCMEVNSRQNETAIHSRFDSARVNHDKKKPGREIFYATPEVIAWVGELIKRQTAKVET